MFTDQDLKQISERGISLETVEKQLAEIQKGFPFLKIEDAAAVGKGIMSPDEATRKAYLDKWAEYVGEGHRIVKFVPASGAASRMFKNLFAFLDASYDVRNLKNKDIFEKTKEYAPTETIKKDIEKIGSHQKAFKNLNVAKFVVSTALALGTYNLMTNLKQKYTNNKIRTKLLKQEEANSINLMNNKGLSTSSRISKI